MAKAYDFEQIDDQALRELCDALNEASYPLGDPTNFVGLMHWLAKYTGIQCPWRNTWCPDLDKVFIGE